MKIVNTTLASHKGMCEIGHDATTNGGKSRLGLCGTAICRLSARLVGLERFLQNGSGEENRKVVK
jgi:hypothetical protein